MKNVGLALLVAIVLGAGLLYLQRNATPARAPVTGAVNAPEATKVDPAPYLAAFPLTPLAAPPIRGTTPAARALENALGPYRKGDYAAAASALDGVRLDHPGSDVDATAEALLNAVRTNPGQGINELSSSLGVSPKELRLPVMKMLGDGRLKTTGQKRGTKYHIGSGRAPSKKRKARRRRAKAPIKINRFGAGGAWLEQIHIVVINSEQAAAVRIGNLASRIHRHGEGAPADLAKAFKGRARDRGGSNVKRVARGVIAPDACATARGRKRRHRKVDRYKASTGRRRDSDVGGTRKKGGRGRENAVKRHNVPHWRARKPAGVPAVDKIENARRGRQVHFTVHDLDDLRCEAGEIVVRARLTRRIARGVVYTTFHFPESGVNLVTTENSDWATNCPEYKVTAVEVAKVTQPDAWRERVAAMRAARKGASLPVG